ncbi:hypothetical protein [Flavobacterium collinsii]|uniref:Uncharacterized protein n=1 Tax=Flavobacterium collinsii TaxID=1114861 RepID=A0A9W4TJH5_9FLAO|nr:hypothetical protein [Flavobacterium collinsii]CAI2768198.1 conserved protein of unknown function [Flavobacterium collinsii]
MNIIKVIALNKLIKTKTQMRNIIFLLLVTINLFSKPLQQKDHLKDKIVVQATIAEIYYNRLEVSTRLPYFANKFIDRKAKQRAEVPFAIWQTIKNTIDYSLFKNAVIQLLNNNFTTAQMQVTVNEYQAKPYIPIVHLKLRNELQLASQDFDAVLLNHINTVLIANGYQALTL